jgi:transcription termination factor NusB
MTIKPYPTGWLAEAKREMTAERAANMMEEALRLLLKELELDDHEDNLVAIDEAVRYAKDVLAEVTEDAPSSQ